MLRLSVSTALLLAAMIACAGWYVAERLQQHSIAARAAEPKGADSPSSTTAPSGGTTADDPALVTPIPKTEAEWKKVLTPEQFEVLRKHGTERAFTGAYYNSKKPGVYRCSGCGLPLFDSASKFDSGTGWPSFWQPIDGVKGKAVGEQADNTLFAQRIEVHCNRCRGHLGHVFADGPAPTGLRYCINSVSIKLDESKAPADKAAETKK